MVFIMRDIVKEMVDIWQMVDVDWLGYKLEPYDKFSYHHIIKREHGGLETISNGAILCYNTSHQYLHIIEYKDFDMYMYLTSILLTINNQRTMPSREQLITISNLLKQFENDHIDDVNAKGKPIIRERYLKRVDYELL